MAKKKLNTLANTTRGITELKLGGHLRTLRFRTNEISILEERLGVGITKILSEDMIGLRVLREAILVGVAHEFAGRGKEAKLSSQKVSRWIDQYGDEGGDLGDLTKSVYEAIALGLPGGKKLMDDAIDDEEEENSPLVLEAS